MSCKVEISLMFWNVTGNFSCFSKVKCNNYAVSPLCRKLNDGICHKFCRTHWTKRLITAQLDTWLYMQAMAAFMMQQGLSRWDICLVWFPNPFFGWLLFTGRWVREPDNTQWTNSHYILNATHALVLMKQNSLLMHYVIKMIIYNQVLIMIMQSDRVHSYVLFW